jgi:hypothetical protein
MPILSKRRVVAAKIETTAGTAISLAAADSFYTSEAKVDADIGFNVRTDDLTLGHRTGVVGAKKGKITFKLELKGSGTAATSPNWALILLPACGMVGTSGVWTPSSAISTLKTLTIAVYEDGLQKKLVGAMGSWSLEAEAGKPVSMSFEFEGIWTAPIDAAILTPPEVDTIKPPAFMAATLTVGGTGHAPVSKLSLMQGNKKMVREDVTAATGYTYAVITDRDYTGKIDPEAVTVATRDVWGDFVAGTEAAMVLSIGSASGNTIAIGAPKIQTKTINESDRNGLVTHELDFQLNKSTAAGEDEITITF